MRKILSLIKPSTRSLKTTLAFYFIPISIIPTFSISFYAYKLFEESTKENIVRQGKAEREAIINEIDSVEAEMVAAAKVHSKNSRLAGSLRTQNKERIQSSLDMLGLGPRTNPLVAIRVYSPDGNFLGARKRKGIVDRVDYLSREGLRKVKVSGETVERYFLSESEGWVTIIRFLLKDSNRIAGVLEEEIHFGKTALTELKERRQVDVVLVARDFKMFSASLALSSPQMSQFATKALQKQLAGSREPVNLSIGDSRYAAFLFDLPAGKVKNWGYLGVLVPLSTVDATLNKLKLAILYLTILLVSTALLAIMVVSNRLVRPIVYLVAAMKRVKTGRVEEIPPVDSTYEIEYLVRSFNDMTRNVSAAKKTLELKLEELRKANQEIKNTQTTLVQSAKMISLGQIVAGVAHELNNPIAFIYSNMHHLSDYIVKIKKLVLNYREMKEKLPKEEQEKAEKIERDLDVDFILKDIEDLTQSCVEGANRTKEIVLGLRSFSRMDESSFRFVDIHEGLRSTVKLLTSEFKDRITLHEEYTELPQVECNISQMNQVFLNLLSNASHAISGRGDIWVRTRLEDQNAVIEIEDSGHGMDPVTLEKVFDPFFTTKKVGEGTGLGLSITYGLVQKHHGTIEVTSEPSRGTCFIIRLPLSQPKLQEIA